LNFVEVKISLGILICETNPDSTINFMENQALELSKKDPLIQKGRKFLL
jgi:hypothetical protein